MLIFGIRPWYQTLSKAFSKSKKTTTVFSFLLKEMASSSTTLVSWFEVERPCRKVNCSGLIIGEICFFYRVNIRIFKSLAMVLSKKNGRWLVGISRFFSVLWNLNYICRFPGIREIIESEATIEHFSKMEDVPS